MDNIVELRKIGNNYGFFLPLPCRLALGAEEGDFFRVMVEGDKVILSKGAKNE